MRSARILVMTAFVLLVSACGASPSPGETASPVTSVSAGVILGIYSGRPDPEWTLTSEEAATLTAMLTALPVTTATPPVGGLGYHGFAFRMSERVLIAYRGMVAPPGDGPRLLRADPARSVERYLLETGRPHLTAAEISEVRRALAGS